MKFQGEKKKVKIHLQFSMQNWIPLYQKTSKCNITFCYIYSLQLTQGTIYHSDNLSITQKITLRKMRNSLLGNPKLY